MFDTLITGGRIIDGTGTPWFHGAIGIEGSNIQILRGDISAVQADRVIDASGCVVCPGFIDCHTHSDLMALSNPLHEPKIMQGITSEIVGVDGMGYAPLSGSNLQTMKLYWSGTSGNPKLEAQWGSVAEYLGCFYHKTSVNVGFLIPNGVIRMEEVGWEDRRATNDEMRRMQDAVRKGMEEGALGLSSGLNYPPSVWADTDELVELCKVVADFGGIYATHVRYHKGDGVYDGFKEAVEIGRRSGVAVSIQHYHCSGKTRGRPDKLLEIIDQARQGGIDITFDAYPYEYGSGTLSSPAVIIPFWAHEGGPHALLQRLKSKVERSKMKAASRSVWENWESWNKARYVSGVASRKNKWCEGLTLQEISDKLGKDVMDVVCDLLIEEDLQVVLNSHLGDERDIETMMSHPACMVCSDGILIGGLPNPRAFGSFPKVIRWLTREAKVLTLEKAINKMTCLTARRYGLLNRGVLYDGMKADVVIFDPEKIADKATVAKPKQYPRGINYIFVNGKLVIEKGKHLGVLNGEPVERGSS